MDKIQNWLIENFPPREFMLRSTSGMKYFKLGSLLQIIFLLILLFAGIFVGLFTYKMQVLQSVNKKQSFALTNLKSRYGGFTSEVSELREKIETNAKIFDDSTLDVELQMRKATKLLSMLEADIAKISEKKQLKEDNRLILIKDRLEKVIQEKEQRAIIINDLDEIIKSLHETLDQSLIYENTNFFSFLDDLIVSEDKFNARITKNYEDLGFHYSKKIKSQDYELLSSVNGANFQSLEAIKELKFLEYALSLKEEESIFYDEVNKNIQNATNEMIEEKINFIETIMKKTGINKLLNTQEDIIINEVGGPFIDYDNETEDLNIISEKIFKFDVLRKRFLSIPLSAPISKYYVTSNYGFRKDPFSGRKAFHSGIDLGAPWGSDIKATSDGVVSFVGKNGSYGNAIFIDHGYGIQTRYAHLSKIFVKKNDKVFLGETIAKIGNSGRSKGKHLHYEIKVGKKSANPKPFLKEGNNVLKKK